MAHPTILFLLALFASLPSVARAEFYACPSIDGDVYTETPARSECRLMEIQPSNLMYERANTASGVLAGPEGPWPLGSAAAQAEICGLYREWAGLAKKRYEGLVLYPPHGLTPIELSRLNNLDHLFSHRGEPHCLTQP